MSLKFSDTTNLNGILQLIEKELGFEYGHITGNTTRLKEWTAEVNLVHDTLLAKALMSGGTWQPDDSNHSDLPVFTADLVSGTRRYAFTTDDNSNVILDIFRVMVADSDGVYHEIKPVDQQTKDSDTASFFDGQDLGGTPSRYDKTGNAIYLDLVPNYNYTDGLKMYISREGSYFATSDTTKKPGVDGRLHEYYVVAPAFKYALRYGLAVANGLSFRKQELEKLADEVYALRAHDDVKRMTPIITDCR